MKWRSIHVLPAPLDVCEQVILSPATIAAYPHYSPLIEWAKIVDLTREGRIVRRVVHFRPSIDPPFAGSGLTRKDTEWFERFTWDLDAHSATVDIDPNIPERYKPKFECHGIYRLEARGPTHTARVMDGAIRFKVAVVGPLAEMFAVRKLKQQFASEAKMLSSLVMEASGTTAARGAGENA